MNIAVLSSSGKVFVRPDTTWEHDNEDFYVPEFIDNISFTPVVFVRVSRPGRSVSSRFADRYFDGTGFGVLLYPEDMIDGSAEGFACASCIDHTSFLPFPVSGRKAEYGSAVIARNGTPLMTIALPREDMIRHAIESVTRSCYIRTGDIVAIELQPRQALCSRQDGKVRITAESGFSVCDFNIIL